MDKSFNKRSVELGLNGTPNAGQLLKEYLIGKRIKIVKMTGAHNYGPIGTVHEIQAIVGSVGGGTGNVYTSISVLIPQGNNIAFTNFTVIEEVSEAILLGDIEKLNLDKEELGTQIEECDAKIALVKERLSYLKENNLEVFDEEEFKSFRALSLLEDDNLSKLEKAKILANIIRG